MANGHYVIPKLVEDTSLKRARVVDGNGDSYIRVTGTVTSSDLDPIKEALGEPTDTSSENTVIGLLKKIDIKQFGVGKAYEGSTGGEIFNYYGTDSKKNVASGDYSTAMGYNNEANGDYGFVAGSDNYIASGNTNCVALGGNNSCVTSKAITLGNHLTSTATNQTLVGTYNKATALSSPKFVVGVGTSSNPTNAIECNKDTTKIRNNLQLATNSYEVNDITAPLSSPASTADKTLATKAYVDALGGFIPLKQEIYAMYVYSTMDPPIDFGYIPYDSGRVVLKGNVYSNSYGYGSVPATFEAYFDLTTSPKRIDSEVQQTVFSYSSNGFAAITLTMGFSIDSDDHLIVNLIPSTYTNGIVFYDNNRVAQGKDYQNTSDIYFDMMSFHSYFYNY